MKFAAVFCFIVLVAAACAQPPKLVLPTPLDSAVRALNAGDAQGVAAAMVEEPTITDDVPPFTWHGKGAVAAWMKAVAADFQHPGAKRTIELGGLQEYYRLGNFSYVAMPMTYVFKGGTGEASLCGILAVSFTETVSKSQILTWTFARDLRPLCIVQ